MKFYRIREISADQAHVSDHKSLTAARKAVAKAERAGKKVRLLFVLADGSYSEAGR